MSEHYDKGEWFVDPEDWRRIHARDPEDPGTPWKIAEVSEHVGYVSGADDPNSRSIGNAYLITAAPLGFDLAAEILRVCDQLSGREVLPATREELEPLRKMAAAFMAKATGKENA